MFTFSVILEEIIHAEAEMQKVEAEQKRLQEKPPLTANHVPPVTAIVITTAAVAANTGVKPSVVNLLRVPENPIETAKKATHPYGRSCG